MHVYDHKLLHWTNVRVCLETTEAKTQSIGSGRFSEPAVCKWSASQGGRNPLLKYTTRGRDWHMGQSHLECLHRFKSWLASQSQFPAHGNPGRKRVMMAQALLPPMWEKQTELLLPTPGSAGHLENKPADGRLIHSLSLCDSLSFSTSLFFEKDIMCTCIKREIYKPYLIGEKWFCFHFKTHCILTNCL